MRRWFNCSIQNKLTVLVLMAIIPSALLAGAIGAWRDTQRSYAAKASELAGIAAALAAAVSEPLATADRRQVANALKGIGEIRGLTHAKVADLDGETVFQFGHGVLVSGGGGIGLFQLRTTPVELDIMHAGRKIGRLTLIADLSSLDRALRRSIEVAVLVALSSIGVGLLLVRRLQFHITRPLIELAGAMREVRDSKSFEHEVASRGASDETGMLVEAFNAMLSEVRLRDAALGEHRANLEATIEARTHDLAAAAREADRANAVKSEFLATMSHEIRTPMNGMLVMAELMAAGELGPRERRRCEVILRSGETLLAIINDILDLSKIEAGQLTLERVPVDPVQVIDDVVMLFAERAASKGLALTSAVAADVPGRIAADPVRLTQIVSNLVNNALKFTERGSVCVRLERGAGPAGELHLSVTDTGIGIEEDKRASIFDPFTQAEQSTTRRFGGTGIGLTICRRLAVAMGGDLTVESRLGEGSTFTLRWTAEVIEAVGSDQQTSDAVAGATQPRRAVRPARFDGRRILAVDDSALNRMVLTEALNRLGAEVIGVEDGAAAIELIRREAFDLVFMEGSMPVLDGFAATRIIRAREAEEGRPPLPIVGLSAHVVGERSVMWRECGMSDFITKPFTLATISACLERWLGADTAQSGDALAAVEAPPSGLLDPEVMQSIREMQGAGEDLAARVVELYAEHAPKALERLAGAVVEAVEPAAVAAAAHALKSLSRNVGAVRVGQLCEDIESRARSGEAVRELPEAELRQALEQTMAALRAA